MDKSKERHSGNPEEMGIKQGREGRLPGRSDAEVTLDIWKE